MRQSSPSSRARHVRFAVASIAAAVLVAAVLGACGNNIANITPCETPILDEKGVDGGPDPCHCDPPPSSNLNTCGCLSDPNDQSSIAAYQQCMFLYHAEQDAGGDGGP